MNSLRNNGDDGDEAPLVLGPSASEQVVSSSGISCNNNNAINPNMAQDSNMPDGDNGEGIHAQEVQRMEAITKLFAQQNIHDVPSALLESVTSEDREESLYDVHGVSTPIHETPELVQTKLLELAFQLMNGSQNQNHKQEQNSIYEDSSTMTSSISDDCSATTTSSSSSSSCFLDSTMVHNLYRQTAQSSPEFMQRLMLSCLRAESFHVSKAAVRVLRHIEAKCNFFGPGLVGTDLGLEHLTGGLAAPGLLERQALEDGGIQVLRQRDRSGRAIILQCTRVCNDYDPNEVLSKLLFWSGIMATRDEEISKRGIVYIMWRFKQDDDDDDSNEKRIGRVPPLVATFPCMPARVAAVHFCTDDFSLTEVCTKSIPFLESRYRCRLRTHFGSSRECRNNLTTFGIPFDVLPILDDGISLDLQYHKQWIQNASSSTNTTTTSSTSSSRTPFQFQEGGGGGGRDGDGGGGGGVVVVVPPPRPNDVVLGRGPRWKNHPGNHYMRQLLEDRLADFDAAPSRGGLKTIVVQDVYLALRAQTECRFLLYSTKNEAWTEVDEETSLERIRHGFRNLRIQQSKKQQQQQQQQTNKSDLYYY